MKTKSVKRIRIRISIKKRIRKRISNVLSFIRSSHGGSMIFPVVIVMTLVMVMGAMLEFYRMQIIAQGVRESVSAAVLTVSSNNSEAIYGGVREGYSGAYELSGDDWKGTLNEGDIFGELDNILGLVQLGDVHTRIEEGKEIFSLADLEVNIENAPFAAVSDSQQLQVKTVIVLIVPMQFGGKVLPDMKSRLSVTSGFISKF